jgi:peptidoglycan/LPS O-acetylase OafA/YrhL
MSGPSQKSGGFYIPSLDGLRALSILIVFLSHAGMGNTVPGLFGVTVFFFLSGYLITTLLRKEWTKTRTISLSQFYLRRVLRIFPPLYVAVVAASALCLVGIIPATLTWKAFFAQGLFFANYYEILAGGKGMPPGMAILWSLAVEEHFYLFFPLLYLILRKARVPIVRQAVLLAGICLLVLVWRVMLVRSGVSTVDGTQGWDRLAHSSDTRLDSILFGCVLALYGNPCIDETRIPESVWKYALLPLGVATLLFTFVYRDSVFRSTYRYSVQALALVPVFVVGVRYPGWLPMRPLNWSWVRRIGVLSYSLYLLHAVIIVAVDLHLHAPAKARMIVSLVLSYVAADLMYRVVEKPSAELRRNLAKAG